MAFVLKVKWWPARTKRMVGRGRGRGGTRSLALGVEKVVLDPTEKCSPRTLGTVEIDYPEEQTVSEPLSGNGGDELRSNSNRAKYGGNFGCSNPPK